MNKKGKTNTFITYLLITFIIICGIFKYKTIYIEPNNVLEVSISNLLYPFTFLFIILINRNSSFKESHKTIIKVTSIFLIFNLLVSILNTIPSNYYSRNIDSALKQVLTPSYILLNNLTLYLPNIVHIITFSILFYFSHTLMLILYEAMEPYTNKFVACALSMFIPFTLDSLCNITITDTIGLIDFNKMIGNLTSNFVIVIISTLIISLLYILILKLDKNN